MIRRYCLATSTSCALRSYIVDGYRGHTSQARRPGENGSQREQLDEDLDALDERGAVPSLQMYKSLLRTCSKRKSLTRAKRIHAHLANHGLESTSFLGESVVCTLVTCGGLGDALEVFRRLPFRTVVSWTAIISGYANAGHGDEALRMYQCMQQEGLEPDKFTFVSLIKACNSVANLKGIHADASKFRCDSDVFVSSSLINMYAKCGSLVDAQKVFDKLNVRNVVAWNAMLTAYVHLGQVEKAWQLYQEMLEEGVSIDGRTHAKVAQACGMRAEKEHSVRVDGLLTKIESLSRGRSIHAETWRRGFDMNVFIGSSLVGMYRKCGSVVDAQTVFSGLSQQDVVSWNSLLTAYVQESLAEKALQLYKQMMEEGVSPNDRTLVSALHACGLVAENEEHEVVADQAVKLKSLKWGKALHADARRMECEFDVYVGNTLVTCYGKCGSIGDAEIVFYGLLKRDVVSWNAMLTAYAQQGQADKVLQLYEHMLEEGVSPDDRTFLSALYACGMVADKEEDGVLDGQVLKVVSLAKGKAIHGHAWSRGCEPDVFTCNTLLSMYAKCGRISDAEDIFIGMSQRDVASWNVMLAAYAQQGEAEKAVEVFEHMLAKDMTLDEITILCILRACSRSGNLEVCTEIHNRLICHGHVWSGVISSALIHAYGRCSSMVKAQNVFDALTQPDVVSWNALIAGFAREGRCDATLQCFENMCLAGTQPNGVTFLSLLSACSHCGLVDKGAEVFESMSKEHGVAPGIDHYVSMVDLLGRAGHFLMVEELLSTMPMQPNLSIWLCLLSACRKHGNIVLAKHSFDGAVQLQPHHAAAYLMMAHMYADAGMWEEAYKVYDMEQRASTWKKRGQCWIQSAQEVHTFVVADPTSEQHEVLYNLVGTISVELKEAGGSSLMV